MDSSRHVHRQYAQRKAATDGKFERQRNIIISDEPSKADDDAYAAANGGALHNTTLGNVLRTQGDLTGALVASS